MKDERPPLTSVTRDDDDILISVADDGLGMDEETVSALMVRSYSRRTFRGRIGTGIAILRT